MNTFKGINSPLIRRIISEESLRIIEDTDLVSVIAKAAARDVATHAVDILKKHGIRARSKESTKFDLYNPTEKEAWGVLVKPEDMKQAAEKLKPSSKGLIFDPYVKSGEKTIVRR